jgi:WD40 repeat protein
LAFSADGKTLITVRNLNQTKEGFYVSSGEVSVWDTSTGKERQHLLAETWLTSVALSRDGKMLAVGSRGNVKREVNKDGSPKGSEPVGDKKGTVRIWELQD